MTEMPLCIRFPPKKTFQRSVKTFNLSKKSLFIIIGLWIQHNQTNNFRGTFCETKGLFLRTSDDVTFTLRKKHFFKLQKHRKTFYLEQSAIQSLETVKSSITKNATSLLRLTCYSEIAHAFNLKAFFKSGICEIILYA